MAVVTEQVRVGGAVLERKAFSWKNFLKKGFSRRELRGAHIGILQKPLQDMMVGFEQFSEGDITQVEVYRGNHGLSARLYFKPNNDFVPTYVVTTAKGMEALQKTESKLLQDPVLEGEVIEGNYGQVNLRRLANGQKVQTLMGQLLSQPDLVYAERMTTHVFDGKDRHIPVGRRSAVVRVFRDRVHKNSQNYTALVFREDGTPLMETPEYGVIGALNVTNDDQVMAHRRRMRWFRV